MYDYACHCEEQSDVAIRIPRKAKPCVCLRHTDDPLGRVALRATKRTDCHTSVRTGSQ